MKTQLTDHPFVFSSSLGYVQATGPVCTKAELLPQRRQSEHSGEHSCTEVGMFLVRTYFVFLKDESSYAFLVSSW